MRLYVGFDDTDVLGSDRGTGKFARWFQHQIPSHLRLHGVVRQQLPVMDGIPYTSHNSAACLILDNAEHSDVEEIIQRGSEHISEHFIKGSDPGLCVALENGSSFTDILEFGRLASSQIVSQKSAMTAAKNFHLSGHGGTNDGIIGAAAGVGLTLSGWSGRFIEFKGLRDFEQMVKVSELEAKGIRVISIDRNGLVPGREDTVDTQNWLRPRLWAGEPVLMVEKLSNGMWRSVGAKKKKVN